MKRLIILTAIVLIPGVLIAQQKAVEKLFNKYQGKDGITTVLIGPELFQVIKSMDIQEIEGHDFPFDKLSGLKILTIEDKEKYPDVNFYKEIEKDLNMDGYSEIMTVNDGGEVVRMWMKTQGEKILEFLLIVGGDDNVVVYISGNFSLNDIQGIAGSFNQDINLDI